VVHHIWRPIVCGAAISNKLAKRRFKKILLVMRNFPVAVWTTYNQF